MALSQRIDLRQEQKQSYSLTLQSYQPILKCAAEDLEKEAAAFLGDNPFVELRSKVSENLSASKERIKRERGALKKSSASGEFIESLFVSEESLFEKLESQICDSSLFPSARAQKIAMAIVDNLSPEGLLDISLEELADEIGESIEEIERIRKRFYQLEPPGVGALNITEALLFQLDFLFMDVEISTESDALYDAAREMILDPATSKKYADTPIFEAVKTLFKSLSYAPAAEFWEREPVATPEIFIHIRSAQEVRESVDKSPLAYSINEQYYPEVVSENCNLKDLNDEEKKIVKGYELRGKDLQNALELRKSTIEKIAKFLIIRQRDFFLGGDLAPMKLSDIADALDYSNSTISRAIENKYLETPSGKIMRLKSFFTTGISSEEGEVSNATIKQFITALVENESRVKPLSDKKILQLLKDKFKIQMERRTITKYRKSMGIASSSERKKLYEISG